MKIIARFLVCAFASMALFSAGHGWAEVEISVVLTGSVEEISAILKALEEQGIAVDGSGDGIKVETRRTVREPVPRPQANNRGKANRGRVKPATARRGQPTRRSQPNRQRRVLPNTARGLQPGPAPELNRAPTRPSGPRPQAPAHEADGVAMSALSGIAISPRSTRPGQPILVTAKVEDPRHAVDTVAASVAERGNLTFDLYDNGAHGDQVAGDGLWSYELRLPDDLAPGEYTINLTAHDAYGGAIRLQRDDAVVPLQAKSTITVQR